MSRSSSLPSRKRRFLAPLVQFTGCGLGLIFVLHAIERMGCDIINRFASKAACFELPSMPYNFAYGLCVLGIILSVAVWYYDHVLNRLNNE